MANLWLILDVETTGLDPAAAGVWQLGAVLWMPAAPPGLRDQWLEKFVHPPAPHWTEEHRARARQFSDLLPPEEGLINDAPDLEQTLLWLVNLLRAWHPSPVIATSYNLPFEQAFLDREPAAISRLACEAGLDFRWGPCLMAAAVKALAPEKERLSLQKACAALGIAWSGSHRALADARLAAQVGERLGVFTREEEAP